MGTSKVPPVFFGHRRLSIIDLEGGAQPLSTPCGRYVITFNGEIYNYKELRRELKVLGYSFQTNSDTEVLLVAYQHWGPNCLERLEGMFAFAVADYEKCIVFCARDPFGIKPFVYRTGPKGVAFASEIPALKELPGWPPPTVDPEAVALFFRYQFIPAPHTIYQEIRKLPAGHALEVSFAGSVNRIWRYFSPDLRPDPQFSMKEAEAEVEKAISDAVLAATISDVPIGVFLSGGIDSTLIALNLARFYDKPVPAFTIDYDEPAFSELAFAQGAAEKLGLNLTVGMVGADILLRAPQILANFGEPYGDSSILATWEVCRVAREKVTVVLSGDGGDELFGGYSSYSAWMKNSADTLFSDALRYSLSLRLRKAKAAFKKIRKGRDLLAFWHEHIQYNSPEFLKTFLVAPYRLHSSHYAEALQDKKSISARNRLEYVQHNDLLSYLPDCILPKVDTASMSHGLEARPPFLSRKVFEVATRLPSCAKMNASLQGKIILKNILRKHGFSSSFVDRPKQGFMVPRHFWFIENGKGRKHLEEALYGSNLLHKFINMDALRNILNSHSLARDMAGQLWLAYAFAVWLNTHAGNNVGMP